MKYASFVELLVTVIFIISCGTSIPTENWVFYLLIMNIFFRSIQKVEYMFGNNSLVNNSIAMCVWILAAEGCFLLCMFSYMFYVFAKHEKGHFLLLISVGN